MKNNNQENSPKENAKSRNPLASSIPKAVFGPEDLLSMEGFQSIILALEEIHNLALSLFNAKGDIISVPSARAGCSYCILNVLHDFGARCRESDRAHMAIAKDSAKVTIYACYSGLNDVIIPISYEGNFLGAIVTGQIRIDGDSTPDFEKLSAGRESVRTDLMQQYAKVPVWNRANLEKVCGLVFNIVNSFIRLSSTGLSRTHEINSNSNYSMLQIAQMTKQAVENDFREDISLEGFAQKFDIKPSSFSRHFKEFVGMNFKDFLLACRLSEAKRLLQLTDQQVCDIAYAVGFGDSNHFSVIFKKKTGHTPKAFRQFHWKEKKIETLISSPLSGFINDPNRNYQEKT